MALVHLYKTTVTKTYTVGDQNEQLQHLAVTIYDHLRKIRTLICLRRMKSNVLK